MLKLQGQITWLTFNLRDCWKLHAMSASLLIGWEGHSFGVKKGHPCMPFHHGSRILRPLEEE